jgi:hypothetical protein
VRRSVIFCAFAPLLGCGPIQTGTVIVEAQAELAAAQTAEAKKNAPFEYVAAEEYLHKAREKQSYSEYELSLVFARKARECAKAARRIAEGKVRTAMGASGLSDTANARCRPGPERTVQMLDPNQEPAAQEPPEPKAKTVPVKSTGRAVVVPAGQSSQAKEPKDPAVKPATKSPTKSTAKTNTGKEESLPEGDDEATPPVQKKSDKGGGR